MTARSNTAASRRRITPPVELRAEPHSLAQPGDDILQRLASVLESRRGADPDQSYVARLFAKGTDAILKKIGEEATETVMAAKDGQAAKIVSETADLWFHCLVMLAHFKLSPADVLAELARREGLSGLEEKAARTPTIKPAGSTGGDKPTKLNKLKVNPSKVNK